MQTWTLQVWADGLPLNVPSPPVSENNGLEMMNILAQSLAGIAAALPESRFRILMTRDDVFTREEAA